MDDETLDKMVDFSVKLRYATTVSHMLSALLNYEFEDICDLRKCGRACYEGRGCPNDERLFAERTISDFLKIFI